MAKELSIQLKIVTPERTVFEGDVFQATLPVSNGEVTILPNHRSYIASLKPGEAVLKKDAKDKEETDIFVSGGFIEFTENKLTVLADEAQRAEEIDIKSAEDARKRAEDIKNNRISVDEEQYAQVAATLQKEMARIKVARKHRTRRGVKMAE